MRMPSVRVAVVKHDSGEGLHNVPVQVEIDKIPFTGRRNGEEEAPEPSRGD